MTVYAVMTTIVVSLLIGAVSRPVAAAVPGIARTPSYSNLTGRVVLDDERVLVQAFSIQPGQSTGRHRHHDAELLVFVKGGVLKSEVNGRATLWRDGRAVWLDPSTSEDQRSRNVGSTPIELMEVILKLRSPTRLTRNLCALLKRPYVLVDARQMSESEAVAVCGEA